MLVTGDVMLGRTVNSQTKKYNDYSWAFRNIAEEFNIADIVFINLESPFAEDCPVVNNGMRFCTDLKHLEGLKYAGVDIASLANNHAMNYGIDGVNLSEKVLSESDILMVGYINPTYYVIGDIKIGLLGYDDVECYENSVACADKEIIYKDIQEAKKNSDIVVIMYSWGAEYRDIPTSRQVDLAHFSVDSGADLILGNHPHWYQPIEIYNDKVIMYSHGNLIFDQMWSQRTREGVVGKYYFSGDQLVDVEFLPIYIENYGQPKIIEGVHANQILGNLETISYKLRDN